MRSEEILERVRPLIAETYDVAEGSVYQPECDATTDSVVRPKRTESHLIEMENSFIGDYKTDHTRLMSLMDRVEEEFDIFLAGYEKKRADNVRGLVRMIAESLKKHR